MKKYNELNNILSEHLSVKPHYLSKEIWNKLKGILCEIRYTLVNIFLNDSDINEIEYFINHRLDEISELGTIQELEDCNIFIMGCLYYFLDQSIDLELYESSSNLNRLILILKETITIDI